MAVVPWVSVCFVTPTLLDPGDSPCPDLLPQSHAPGVDRLDPGDPLVARRFSRGLPRLGLGRWHGSTAVVGRLALISAAPVAAIDQPSAQLRQRERERRAGPPARSAGRASCRRSRGRGGATRGASPARTALLPVPAGSGSPLCMYPTRPRCTIATISHFF